MLLHIYRQDGASEWGGHGSPRSFLSTSHFDCSATLDGRSALHADSDFRHRHLLRSGKRMVGHPIAFFRVYIFARFEGALCSESQEKTGPISRPHPNPQLKLNYQHIPIALRSDDIADSVVPAFVLCNRFERNILCI